MGLGRTSESRTVPKRSSLPRQEPSYLRSKRTWARRKGDDDGGRQCVGFGVLSLRRQAAWSSRGRQRRRRRDHSRWTEGARRRKSHERRELARTRKSRKDIGRCPVAAGAGLLLAALETVLQLGDLRGHGVFASCRLGVVAGARVLAPRGGEVIAVLRVIVVGERLEKHRGNVGPAVGIEVGAYCLAEGADVDRVGRKGNIGFGQRVVVMALELEVAGAPSELVCRRLGSDGG